MLDPMLKFQQWWQQAICDSPLQQKSAVCISTIDELGYPASRFVDLKAVDDQGLVFCTYMDSSKGKQLSANPKVGLTAWWDHLGYQIRVVGTAEEIEQRQAETYWQTRNRDAQMTTRVFAQSQPLATEAELEERIREYAATAPDVIAKPDNWGGYRVKPISIEFLTFKASRLHLRELYQMREGQWSKGLLQP